MKGSLVKGAAAVAAGGYWARLFTLDKFLAAFTASFSMIIATEIGDRTFFIAAIMAMRYSRLAVLAGALGALIAMTVISGIAGIAAITWIPKPLVHYAVIGLMLFFGVQMVRTGLKLNADAGFDELEEVESEARKKDEEEGRVNEDARSRPWLSVAIEAFTLTFLAEWGDRSQLATIALTAAHPPIGVMIGGFLGHALCTGFAVVGGRLLANYISERTVNLAGGVLFIIFGLYSLLMGM